MVSETDRLPSLRCAQVCHVNPKWLSKCKRTVKANATVPQSIFSVIGLPKRAYADIRQKAFEV